MISTPYGLSIYSAEVPAMVPPSYLSPLTARQRNGVLLRLLFYIALFVIYNLGIHWEARLPNIGYDKFDSSHFGFSEFMQNLMLGLSVVFTLMAYAKWPVLRNGCLLLALFLLASMARQNHLRIEDLTGTNAAWKIMVTLLAIYALYTLIRHWKDFLQELNIYAGTYSFGLLMAGILTTYVFSRLFGRQILWMDVMGEHYIRIVKNLAEETTESIGYMLICMGALELCLLARRFARQIAVD